MWLLCLNKETYFLFCGSRWTVVIKSCVLNWEFTRRREGERARDYSTGRLRHPAELRGEWLVSLTGREPSYVWEGIMGDCRVPDACRRVSGVSGRTVWLWRGRFASSWICLRPLQESRIHLLICMSLCKNLARYQISDRFISLWRTRHYYNTTILIIFTITKIAAGNIIGIISYLELCLLP